MNMLQIEDNFNNSNILNTKKSLSSEVSSLNFQRLRYKYTTSSDAEFSKATWDHAELEYRRFLDLKKIYPAISFVPSKLVDKIWHAHILDTQAYREDCLAVFGKFIDHFPYFGIYGKDDYSNLQDAFKETISLYEKHFGPYPSASSLESNAARCQDHACHAPSSCACRVSGACK